MRCQLHLWRDRLLQSGHPFRHASGMDRHFHCIRLHTHHVRRPSLRLLGIRVLCATCAAVDSHHLQSTRNQRFAFMACHGASAPSACRVRKVCNGLSHLEISQHLCREHPQLEAFRHCLRHHCASDAVHHHAEGDRVGTGLSGLFPDVLPRRHDGQHPVHGHCSSNLLCGGHPFRGGNALGHADICRQVCRARGWSSCFAKTADCVGRLSV